MRRNCLTLVLFLTLSCAIQQGHVKAQSDAGKLEIGGHFTSIIASDPPIFPRTFTRWIPGLGGRVGFNLTNTISLESELNIFPRGGESDKIGEGRKLQGLFGAKVGVRRTKIGIFGKLRPGFMYFTEPFEECPEEENICMEGKKLRFAVDFGVVVEIYSSSRVLVRFDAGDTLIHFPDIRRSLSEPGFPTKRFTIPGGTTHNFQFSAGVGLRF